MKNHRPLRFPLPRTLTVGFAMLLLSGATAGLWAKEVTLSLRSLD